MSCPRPWKTFNYLIGLVVLFGFVSEPQSFDQKAKRQVGEQELPETRDLFLAETIPFQAPPPSLAATAMKCDLNGNIYLVYTDAPEAVLSQRDAVARLPIQRLSVEHKAVAPFPLPSIPGYDNVLRYDFDVDGRGQVYALLSAWNDPDQKEKSPPASLILKYKDDGTMDSVAEIRDVPGKRFQPLSFAAFPDGNFLVTGTAPDEQGLGVFTAIFDRAGTFMTDVKVPEDVDLRSPNAATHGSGSATGQEAGRSEGSGSHQEDVERHPPRGRASKVSPVGAVSGGLAFSSPDGNIYLLRATDPPRLYVVSRSGEVVREFEVRLPARGLSPIQMAMAGGDKVFIQFGHIATGVPGENSNAPRLIAVLNPSDGQVTAVYRLASEEVSTTLSACAASPYNFLFVGTGKNNKLEVRRYSPHVY